MARETKHGHVIEGVEDILGQAALAPGLVVRDPAYGVTKLRDQPAHVRISVTERAELFYHFPVIEAEPGHVLKQLDVSQPADEPVIKRPQCKHKAILRACGLLSQHDLEA